MAHALTPLFARFLVTAFPLKRVLLGLAAGILLALYFTGRLDPTLYKVGLNFHRCGQNGFGAVFCGSALTDYENRINSLNQATTTASSTAATTASSTAATTPTSTLPVNTGPDAAAVVDVGPGVGSGVGLCAHNVAVAARTSCQFAENVYALIVKARATNGYVPAHIRVYSPVTNRDYAMTCEIDNVPEVVCSTADGAVVSIPY